MTATTDESRHSYLPGMGQSWLLAFYDPLQRLLGIPSAHRALVDQADVRPGQRVLEIGCGTGNLVTEVKRRQPRAAVTGLDPDPRALARAQRKARRHALDVRLEEGFAQHLPYPDATFDVVLSAFMFHHLGPDERREALRETRRVLARGGALHLVDFGGIVDPADGFMARLAHRSQRLQDNLGDRIPELMKEAGLAEPAQVGHRVSRAMGRITYYRAMVPVIGTSAPEGRGVPGAYGVGR